MYLRTILPEDFAESLTTGCGRTLKAGFPDTYLRCYVCLFGVAATDDAQSALWHARIAKTWRWIRANATAIRNAMIIFTKAGR